MDGDLDGLWLGLTEGDFDGEMLTLGLTLVDGLTEGDFEGLTLGLLLGLTDGLFEGEIETEGLTEVEGLTLTLGDTLGDLEAMLMPALNLPIIISNRFMTSSFHDIKQS